MPYLRSLEKIAGGVVTDTPGRNAPFKAPDTEDNASLPRSRPSDNEVRQRRLPSTLSLLHARVGNIRNAVLGGIDRGRFGPLTAYPEVIQDGMLGLMRAGALATASALALCLSEYQERIVLRPQEICNHPVVIRRLGLPRDERG